MIDGDWKLLSVSHAYENRRVDFDTSIVVQSFVALLSDIPESRRKSITNT
jgi:hypothetical protein